MRTQEWWKHGEALCYTLRLALLLTALAFVLTLTACASGPQSVPIAVKCPSLPAVPADLMRPPQNQYLLPTTEPSKPEPQAMLYSSSDCRSG